MDGGVSLEIGPMNNQSNVSEGVVVFIRYITYKKQCARECTQPVSYVAWMWLQGLTDVCPY